MKNEKKLNYEEAKIEFVVFDAKDILTTSGFDGVWDEISKEEAKEE